MKKLGDCKCVLCGGDGFVDTGAQHPWGEWIKATCECVIEKQVAIGSCRGFVCVQVGEDEGIPVYSEVDMSETNDPDYRWRPATKGDIGSIARFCDVRSPHEDWWYGILVAVEQDTFDRDIVWVYHCKHGGDMDDNTIEQFNICEIQYDANKEP